MAHTPLALLWGTDAPSPRGVNLPAQPLFPDRGTALSGRAAAGAATWQHKTSWGTKTKRDAPHPEEIPCAPTAPAPRPAPFPD